MLSLRVLGDDGTFIMLELSRTIRAGIAVALLALANPPIVMAEFDSSDWTRRVEAETSIDGLAKLYVEYLLESNPTFGINIGVHGRDGDPSYYDDRLADTSAEAWASGYETLLFLRQRFASIDVAGLSEAEKVDLHILKNQVEQQILQVTRLGAMTNPLGYVSGLGTAFSGLVLRDYAPVEQRLVSFGRRCAATADYLKGAKAALLPPHVQPTGVQKQVTVARLKGMVKPGGLFDKSLPELIQASDLSSEAAAEIEQNCAGATAAINEFTAWFEQAVLPRPDGEWRLGRKLYEEKYAVQMDYPLDADELLGRAEQALDRTHAEMVDVSRRIHDGYLAEEIKRGDIAKAADLDDQDVVRNIFAKLSEDRSTADTLIADSYALADAIVGFVNDKDLMDLPPTSKLRIEDVPPHLAGYAVAQIIPAPAFEPELESVWFWDLGLLATSDSYLKEYNRPTLAMVYIHEGVPGHFVQLEYSNRFDRITPKVFLNGPMVEGWATYIATQLVDEGFTIYPDHPYGHELQQLVDDKLVMRGIINAIIDIRLHTTDWSEEEAVALMTGKGFQEPGEAQGKLTRAKLSSVQLATYFAGQIAILELLEEYKKIRGDEFSWKEFNERLVGVGSPPFFAIREQMLGD